MLNFLLTAAAFILSTATFTLSFSYSGVSRTFTSFGKAIAEISVVIPNEVDGKQENPYFDVTKFEAMAKEHFDKGLKRYLKTEKDYSLSYFYFDALSENKEEDLLTPTGIKMSFVCPISWFGVYENQTTFSLKGGNLNE